MKQKRLSIHRGLQGLWLLAALLLLAPTGLRAQETMTHAITFSDYANEVISGNVTGGPQSNWDVTLHVEDGIAWEENGVTADVNSGRGMTTYSQRAFTGTLTEVRLPMAYDENLAISATFVKVANANYGETNVNSSANFSYNSEGNYYYYVLEQSLDMNSQVMGLSFSTISKDVETAQVSQWTGVQLIGYDIEEVDAMVLYGLTVAGTRVTSENAANITGNNITTGSVAFDPTTSTLTLNNATLASAVSSTLDALTISLVGENSISGAYGAIVGENETSSLTIAKASGDEGAATLSLNTTQSQYQSVVRGFASFTTDLFMDTNASYSENDKTLMEATGAPVLALTLTSELAKPSLYGGYNSEDGTYYFGFEGDPDWEIHYAIDYVNSKLEDVEDAVYDMQNGDVTLQGAATVTGWRVQGDYTSATVKGKLFELSETSLSTILGTEATVAAPALVPAIAEVDGITVTYSQSSVADFSNIAAIDETTGVMTINGAGTATFNVEVADGDNCFVFNEYNDVPLSFTLTVADGYPLYVTPSDGQQIQVTAANRENVLGDDKASVKYDGYNTLIFNGAALEGVVYEGQTDLNIFLVGDNTIGGSNYAFESGDGGLSASLTFETACNNPGSLMMSGERQLLNGFNDVLMKQPLAVLSTNVENYYDLRGTTAAVTSARVGTPLGLIIDNVAETTQDVATDIDYNNPTGDNARVASGALTNIVINNVLYTLNDTQTAYAADDGYDNGRIVLNSIMTDAAVETLNGNVDDGTLVPGTDAYASAYNGLTFIVPAGTGTITLETETAADREFHLKVGAQDPVVVVNKADNNGNAFALDYAVSKSTYVYLYLTAKTTANAPKKGPHRIGPKSGVGGGLGSLGVSSSASAIASAVTAPSSYLMCTSSMVARSTSGGITVDNAGVTDIDASVFSGGGSHAPRRALYDGVPYVDLSKTSIIGKEISRTSGAFAGFPEETLIYVPAGNTTTEKNVIIGTICDHLLLNGSESNTKTFEFGSKLATFTAAKATLDRTFEVGKTATVYVPFDIDKPTDFGTFSTVTAVDTENMTVTLSPAATVTANTAYVFEPTATKLEVKTVTVKKPAGSSSDKLLGTYSRKDYVPNMYCYAAQDEDESDIKKGDFVRMGTGSYVPPFRAYMLIDSAAPVFSIIWSDSDMSTGVAPMVNVQSSKFNAQWYTLDGRRLASQPTAKGIYVNNGRKVVIK